MGPSLQTLFLALDHGDISPRGRTLFLGAELHPSIANLDADLWLAFKPLAFAAASPDLPKGDNTYGLALVLLPKQAAEARYWVALALERLKEGGILLAAAANDAGGSRIEGWFKEAGLSPASLSKNKCRAVWAAKPAKPAAIVKDWLDAGVRRRRDIGDGLSFVTQPGLFSWDRADVGSKLLAAHLPADLAGTGADFGAGIGYLSHHILKNSPQINALHVLEADARALACARENLANVAGNRDISYGWTDLAKDVQGLPPLDFVVMNPPFHEGKKTQAALGQAFVATAFRALKKGGHLWMVAITHLPYEDILRGLFKDVQPVAQRDGFKIIKAVKQA